jgi:hypothetical protein
MSSSTVRVVTGRRDPALPSRHAAEDARKGGGTACVV